MHVRDQTGQTENLASRTGSPRSGVMKLLWTPEPLIRDWALAERLFIEDREALRRRDFIVCSALEMAESMDRFLNPIARP